MARVPAVPMEQMEEGTRQQQQIWQGAEHVRLVLGNEEISRDQCETDQREFPARIRLAVTLMVVIREFSVPMCSASGPQNSDA